MLGAGNAGADDDDDDERRKKIKYMLIGFIAGCIGGYVFYLYIADSKVNQLRKSSNKLQKELNTSLNEKNIELKAKQFEIDNQRSEMYEVKNELKAKQFVIDNQRSEMYELKDELIKKKREIVDRQSEINRLEEWELEKQRDEGSCFSSESYVFVFPEYKKKKIDELIGNEKILSYDRIKNTFVWDAFIYKSHCDNEDVLHDELIEMIKVTLENNLSLIMTGNHLIFVNDDGLKRMDHVKIGDIVKHYIYGRLQVVEIKKTCKYPRNIWTYNGNVVVNGIAISCFTDSAFSQLARPLLDIYNSLNLWRYPVYMCVKTAQYLKIIVYSRFKFY